MTDYVIVPEEDHQLDPTPRTPLTRAERRKARRRKIFIGLAAAAVVISATGAGTAYALSRPASIEDQYVFGTVTTGDVASTLTYSGTVNKTNQKQLSFPTSATVTSLSVSAGDTVTAGQQIATIDTTSLEQEVNKAQAALDQAKLTLWEAENPSSSSSSSSSAHASSGTGGSSSSNSGGSGSGSMGGSSSSPGSPSKNGLMSVLSAVEKAQAQSSSAIAGVVAACSGVTSGGTDEPTQEPTDQPTDKPTDRPTDQPTDLPTDQPTDEPTDSPTQTPTDQPTVEPTAEPSDEPTQEPSDQPTDEPTDEPTDTAGSVAALLTTTLSFLTEGEKDSDSEDITACMAAVQTLVDAQNALSTASSQLAKAAQSLQESSSTLQCQSSSTPSGSSPSGSSPTASGSSSSSSPSASGGMSAGSTTMSVESAQAAVDAAQVNLDNAKADLAAATMTSPIDGVVAQLPFSGGDTATPSDSVIIIGEGSSTITLTVPVARVSLLTKGQEAVVAQNSMEVSASVTSVSLIPVSSTNYSVVITTDADDPNANRLLAGATAMVTITTATISNATLVPISAVTLDASGTSGTVSVVEGDEVITKKITISAIGDTSVAVTEGVEPGDRVVIADKQQELPSSGTNAGTTTIMGASTGFTGPTTVGSFPGR